MSDRKVVPIGGKHRSFQSLAGAAMDSEADIGVIFWFDKEGTMHMGEFGMTRSAIGLAQMYIQMMAVEAMQAEDG